MTLSAPKPQEIIPKDVSTVVLDGNKKASKKAERPVPREGFPRFVYMSKCRTSKVLNAFGMRWDFANPKMTAKDQLDWDVEELIGVLKLLAMHAHRIIAVVNEKGGGGKSPLIALLAGVFKYFTGYGGVLIDLNTAKGTMEDILGIDRGQTLGLSQALTLREELMIPGVLEGLAKPHYQTGLRFIANSQVSPTLMQPEYLYDLLRSLRQYATTFVDNGSDTQTFFGKVNYAAADALVFSALYTNEESLGGVAKALRHTIVNQGLQKARRQSVVVINGVPKGVKKEDVFDTFARAAYRELRSKVIRDVHDRPIQDPVKREQVIKDELKNPEVARAYVQKYLLVDKDRIFVVPDNDAIREFSTKKGVIMDVSREVLGMETLKVLLEILVYLFKDIIVEDVPSFERDDIADIEFTELRTRVESVRSPSSPSGDETNSMAVDAVEPPLRKELT